MKRYEFNVRNRQTVRFIVEAESEVEARQILEGDNALDYEDEVDSDDYFLDEAELISVKNTVSSVTSNN